MKTIPVMRLMSIVTLLSCSACAVLAGEGVAVENSGEAALPTLVLIAPGTKIGKELPTGWSHLVIESIPKLESGDLGSLPAVSKTIATQFRTAVLADVRRGPGPNAPFALRRVGLGICVPGDGVDTVVSAASLDELQIPLGLITRRVLGRVEEEMARGRLRARTSTFALYNTPAVLKMNGVHVAVLLRYALLVDRDTGALHTLVWTVEEDPDRRQAPRQMAVLAPNFKYVCGLDVAAERLLDTIPTFWSFAMRSLPPGQVLELSPNLQTWALRDRLTPTESAAFEIELRQALAASKPLPRSESLANGRESNGDHKPQDDRGAIK